MARKTREEFVDEAEEDEEDEEDDDFDPSASKKRKKSSIVDDAAEEDDDEEEDDEDEDVGANRARKLKRSRFIDDIAAVDEDEEEEEDEDEVDDLVNDEAEDVVDAEDMQRVYRRTAAERQQQDMDPEALDAYIKQRFEQPAAMYREELASGAPAGVVGQQGLLPTHQDPKLWRVHTRTGEEREACIRLLQKAQNLAASGNPLAIKSAFIQDAVKGCMWVEAHKESHVMEAIRGLRNILVSKGATLVPLGEMVDCITVNMKAKAEIAVGSWVRITKGPYKDDLAKVVDLDESRNMATMQIVPRLDYAAMSQRINEGKKTAPFGKSGGIRPAARAFSPQEAAEFRLPVEQKMTAGGYAYVLNNLRFENGYLLKNMSLSSIRLEEGNPSIEEITRYNQVGATAREDADPSSGLSSLLESVSTAAKEMHFAKGDKIQVTQGDLKGLDGRVHAVREDGTVEMMPSFKELNDVLPFSVAELTKYFHVGDHVKVTGGQHAGQTGMVVRCEDKICTLVSDTTRQELHCFAKDLSESADVSLGLDTFGKYELHDLVVLDQTTTGIIIGVDKDSCRVLTSQGSAEQAHIRVCRQPDLKRKFPDNRRITTQDKRGNLISVGDLVTVDEGRYQGRVGTVKYIVRGHVYIQSREIKENSGFACLRGRQCIVKGARVNGASTAKAVFDPTSVLRSPAPHRIAAMAGFGAPVMSSPRRDAPGGFSARGPPPSSAGRGMPLRDRIVGTSITIAKGPFRGYKGRVVSATETHVRMELEAQYKTVTVPRSQLPMSQGGVPETSQPRRPNAFDAPYTPAYEAGSRTPAHLGSRTPMHPSMTPMHPGSATPLRDSAWNPMTPRRDAHDDDRDGRADVPVAESPGYQPYGSGTYQQAYTPVDTPAAPAATPGFMGTPGLTPGLPGYGIGTPGLDYLSGTPGTAHDPGDAFSPAPLHATPGFQASTPAYSPSALDPSSRAQHFVNMLVMLPDGQRTPGLVRGVEADGFVQVSVGQWRGDPSEEEVDVPADAPTRIESWSDLVPLRPRKGHPLRILAGSKAGKEGRLQTVTGHEGVVKIDGNILILNMDELGRLAE